MSFRGVDIVNINFNVLHKKSEKLKINMNCIPKVFFPKNNDKQFNIVMDVEISEKDAFTLSLRAIGNFELDRTLTIEMKKKFVNVNAPAIMFPYVRSFVSTLTANVGNVVGTLTIPTRLFKGVLEEIK